MTVSRSTEHYLTLHELAILRALADGAQSKEMAALINRSRGTVEFYIRCLFLKLKARSRPHLVAQAFRTGVLTVDRRLPSSPIVRSRRRLLTSGHHITDVHCPPS